MCGRGKQDDRWVAAPHLSLAVGLRDMVLSPEAASQLDQLIEEATTNPPPMPQRRMQTGDASLLK